MPSLPRERRPHAFGGTNIRAIGEGIPITWMARVGWAAAMNPLRVRL